MLHSSHPQWLPFWLFIGKEGTISIVKIAAMKAAGAVAVAVNTTIYKCTLYIMYCMYTYSMFYIHIWAVK